MTTSHLRNLGRWALVLSLVVGCSNDGGRSSTKAPPAVNTLPFDGGVYLILEGPHRFWPTRSRGRYVGFSDSEFFAFRPIDGQLFYSQRARGIRIDDAPNELDSLIPTPPCIPSTDTPFLTGRVDPPFGFDGQGTLHYLCDADLRRGNGELVRTPVGLSGVLADGRAVILLGNDDPASVHYAVTDVDGKIISELHPPGPPGWEPLHLATTVRGNDAFVLLVRGTGTTDLPYAGELSAYRVDPQSSWLHVRSWRVANTGSARLVISDGTIFVVQTDLATQPFSNRIVALLPDGTEQTVWRDADTPGLLSGNQLLVGPREPTGPSVVDN